MMRQLKIIGVLIVVFVNYSLSQNSIMFPDGSCSTPNDLHGLCINILHCPPLLEILKNVNRTDRETQHLRRSQCGEKGNAILVCCRMNGATHVSTLPPKFSDNRHLLPNTRQCGRSFDYRIKGGDATKIDQFPWVALIEYKKPNNDKDHHCGGSLINDRYVITAAHCVFESVIPPGWTVTGVRLGEWDRSSNPDCTVSSNGKRECAHPYLDTGIEKIIYHPLYYLENFNHINDIALIRLDRYVPFTDFISPVCLPVQSHLRSKTFDNVKLDITGWGITKDGSTSVKKLTAAIDGWNFSRCQQKYATKEIYLLNTQMCAGGKEGVDSCEGDSGGPLVAKERLDDRDVYVLLGVISFGTTTCGLPDWPGVYTRVVEYIDWITRTIKC